ncbi:hypothetical protein AB0L59_28220 [Streptomyces sp. NPDC052109]
MPNHDRGKDTGSGDGDRLHERGAETDGVAEGEGQGRCVDAGHEEMPGER